MVGFFGIGVILGIVGFLNWMDPVMSQWNSYPSTTSFSPSFYPPSSLRRNEWTPNLQTRQAHELFPASSYGNELPSAGSLTQALQSEIDRMTSTLPTLLEWVERTTHPYLPWKAKTSIPSGFHIRETEKEIIYFIDVPGISRKEIQVTLERGSILKVKATCQCESDDIYCVTRKVVYDLPVEEEVNPKKITVNLDSGVLRIHLPKKSATRSFTIPVVDSLFGLNQPSKDKAQKIPLQEVKQERNQNDLVQEEGGGTMDALHKVADYINPSHYNLFGQNDQVQDKAWQMEKDAQQKILDWNEKGKETAEQIRKRMSEATARAKEGMAEWSQEATDQMMQGAQVAQDKANEWIDNTQEQAKQYAGYGKAIVEEKTEEITDKIKDSAVDGWDWLTEKAAGMKGALFNVPEAAQEGYERGEGEKRKQHGK